MKKCVKLRIIHLYVWMGNYYNININIYITFNTCILTIFTFFLIIFLYYRKTPSHKRQEYIDTFNNNKKYCKLSICIIINDINKNKIKNVY